MSAPAALRLAMMWIAKFTSQAMGRSGFERAQFV